MGKKLAQKECKEYTAERLPDLIKLSAKHDISHLVVLGLKQNGLIPENNKQLENYLFQAVLRYEQLDFEYSNLCQTLEKAKIPFIPLKGSVIRKQYPKPWMRTSCDIDILVHQEDLEKAIFCLSHNLQYTERERTTHDISFFSPSGIHVELHFDLVEEGRANSAIDVLRSVWDNVSLRGTSKYQYEMNDAFFYFYHIAHMAKHFESGGCGIRPFIDLWILDNMEEADWSARDQLLSCADLLKFAEVSRTLSKVWFECKNADMLSLQMQTFLLRGGVYGCTDNRVALQQKKKGGKGGYLLSRIFIPYEKLKRYYPILEKYRWLMPFMQIRRWFMLLKPNVARMAKRELSANANVQKNKADEMNAFLNNIGLA